MRTSLQKFANKMAAFRSYDSPPKTAVWQIDISGNILVRLAQRWRLMYRIAPQGGYYAKTTTEPYLCEHAMDASIAATKLVRKLKQAGVKPRTLLDIQLGMKDATLTW